MKDRKELKREYKEIKPDMGIFQIRNRVNGKILVVGSRDMKAGVNSYKYQLKFGLFRLIPELQRDYTELGEDSFSFDILDYLKPKSEPGYDPDRELKFLEKLWLEKLQPFGDRGYNKRSLES